MLVKVGQCIGISLLWLMIGWVMPVYAKSCEVWPMWQAFANRYVQSDGRVLADESDQRYSTSEGQVYTLFFALIANDRTKFDQVLLWTGDNLAAGDLGAQLPAWQWGKKPDGQWGVVDQNSASDADVWLAYTLLEAGRLWHVTRYTALGDLLLANIRIHLVREFPGEGAMLLPAQKGFDLESGGTGLNSSYLPVQLLRLLAKHDPTGPWLQMIENSYRLLQASSPKGFVPDWFAYIPGKGYVVDDKRGEVGSYDAIRVYLWWGMLSKQDPMSSRLKKILFGMDQLIPKYAVSPPLSVQTQTGGVSGVSPPGFSAALLPYFTSMGSNKALKLQQDRLLVQQDTQSGVLIGSKLRYYDQVLALFGMGWMKHRFNFSSQGELVVHWEQSCSAVN